MSRISLAFPKEKKLDQEDISLTQPLHPLSMNDDKMSRYKEQTH